MLHKQFQAALSDALRGRGVHLCVDRRVALM